MLFSTGPGPGEVTVKISDINDRGRFAIVIPVFNHEKMIGHVIEKALEQGIPVIVVDDGSTDATTETIRRFEGITALRHDENMGKGAALLTGFREAAKSADWAITIDGDGQHDSRDAINLVRAIIPGNRPIVLGARQGMTGEDVPWTSSFGRKFSNFWVLASGGPSLTDTQTGFRIYPLPEVLELKVKSRRFQFEVEVLARANWRRMPVIEAPISVDYKAGGERVSHFKPFTDFMRNSRTFMGLIFMRIFIPRFIRKRM